MVANPITLRDRLGGRWAVSLRAYSWVGIPWILVGALSEPLALQSPSSFFQWLGISAVSYLALGAVMLLADKTVLNNRRLIPVPLWVAFGVNLVASEVRSLTYIELIHLGNLPDHVPLGLRLFTAALMALTAFPLLTYAFDSWDRYVQERDRLIDEAVTEQVQNLQEQQALEVIRLGIVKELQLRVSQSMSSARNDITKISEASAHEHIGPDVVQIFRDISRSSIRKISHDLRHETEQVNRFRASELISLIAHSRPYRPFLIIPPLAALSLSVVARNESFLLSARLIWLWVLPALAITQFTNWLCSARPRWAVPTYITSVGMLFLLGLIPVVYFNYLDRHWSESIAWGIMGSFAGGIVVPLSGLGDGITLQRQSVLAALRREVENADIAQLALQRERNAITNEIASYMHGTVQASLSASIMRLSQALSSGNQQEAVAAFNHAREALELPEEYNFELKSTTLTEHLDSLKANWAGLIDINSQVDGDELNPAETRILQTISTEAINNAVRHGDADKVSLNIHVTPEVITIDALNNGELGPNEKLGMGLKSLDKYARNDWSLKATNDGQVHLSARIRR